MATSPTGFKYKLSQESLNRPEPFPQAIYKMRLTGFEPRNAKPKPGVALSRNFYPIFTMDAPGQKYDQQEMHYLFTANEKNGNWIQDMVHACGQVMEPDGAIPGIWNTDKAKFVEDNASTWVYSGPLLNQSLEAEFCIAPDDKGILRNKILRFICRVPDCAVKYPKILHTKAIPQGKTK